MRHIFMMRARYGTGDFLKLNKRNCDIRIRLTPWDADFMRVHFRINGDHHYFYPSCVMEDQFSVFLKAIYCLYNEHSGYHSLHSQLWYQRFGVTLQNEYPNEENDGHYCKSFPIIWDEEGRIIHVVVSRRSITEEVLPAGVPDPIIIKFKYWKGNFEYCIDGRDLCYAIARGYTEAIKKTVFRGISILPEYSFLAILSKWMNYFLSKRMLLMLWNPENCRLHGYIKMAGGLLNRPPSKKKLNYYCLICSKSCYNQHAGFSLYKKDGIFRFRLNFFINIT